MIKIAVIILNWNGWKDTLACLGSLRDIKSESFEFRIIIIDNHSSDQSLDKLHDWLSKTKNIPQVELIELKENRGFSGGNNVGIKYALNNGDEYLLLLNNDTIVDTFLLETLLKTIRSDKKTGIVAPKIYFAPGFEFHKNRYAKNESGKVFWFAGGLIDWDNMYAYHRGVDEVDKGQYNKRKETQFVSGCCMLIKSSVFGDIGFLDEELFLYLEDLDFCLRAKEAGFKIIYEPKAFIWHKNAASSGKPGSQLHQYYQIRNRLVIGMRYAPLRTKLALLRESFRFFREGGIHRKAVLDFYVYNSGKGNFN